MGNIITYVQNNLKTFDDLPFSAADSLVLSSLSYFYLPREVKDGDRICHFRTGEKGMLLKELYRAELFSGMFDRSVIKEDGKKLFAAMCASPRFRDMTVRDYADIFDKEIQAQFAAMTFDLSDKYIYVAFRGTGRIFEQLNEPRVIKSDNSGMMQHYPFSWLIEENDFIDCASPSSAAILLSQGFNSAANKMTEEERENFTESLFRLINEDIEDTDALTGSLFGTGTDFFRNYRKMDDTSKSAIKDTLKKIAGGSIRSFSEKIFP